MNSKTLAIVLIVSGAMLFPPLNIFGLGGLAWPMSTALIMAGTYLLAKAGPGHTGKAGPLPTPAPRQAKSTYTIEVDTVDQLIISVIPAHKDQNVILPILLGCAVAIGLVIPMMIVAYASHNMGYLLLAPGAGFLAGYLGSSKLNHDPRRSVRDARFYVSETVIHVRADDGSLPAIPVSTIDRIVTRPTVAGGATEVVSFAGGVEGALGNLFEHTGYKFRQKQADWWAAHSFVLEVESHGRKHLLASGMDEPTAYGLMAAVSKKTGITG